MRPPHGGTTRRNRRKRSAPRCTSSEPGCGVWRSTSKQRSSALNEHSSRRGRYGRRSARSRRQVPDQPRPQRRMALECREPSERRQKDVLHHVIDQISVWQESMASIRVHGVDMGSDEPCSGLPVFSEDGRNQFAFVALVRQRCDNVNGRCGRTRCSRIHTVIVAKEGAFPLMGGRQDNSDEDVRTTASPLNNRRGAAGRKCPPVRRQGTLSSGTSGRRLSSAGFQRKTGTPTDGRHS